MYLRCAMLGSVLNFNKIIKKRYSKVLLDNDETIIFSKGNYFQPIKGWDTVTYEVFETKEECIDFVNKNFNEYKEWNIEKDINKIINRIKTI